jgi:hypothetical protein
MVAAYAVIKHFEDKSPGDGEKEGEWHSPFEKYGGILGSDSTPGTVYNLPPQGTVIFPQPPAFSMEGLITPITEVPNRTAAYRGAGLTHSQQTAYQLMSAIGAGGGAYKPPTQRAPISRTFLPVGSAGIASKKAITAAVSAEAKRVSRAGVAGSGAIGAFAKDAGSYAVSSPRRIGSAGVASGRAISSAVRGVTGITKKEVGSALPSGSASVVSTLQSGFVSRATGGASSKKQPSRGGGTARTGTRRTSVTGKYSGR